MTFDPNVWHLTPLISCFLCPNVWSPKHNIQGQTLLRLHVKKLQSQSSRSSSSPHPPTPPRDGGGATASDQPTGREMGKRVRPRMKVFTNLLLSWLQWFYYQRQQWLKDRFIWICELCLCTCSTKSSVIEYNIIAALEWSDLSLKESLSDVFLITLLFSPSFVLGLLVFHPGWSPFHLTGSCHGYLYWKQFDHIHQIKQFTA